MTEISDLDLGLPDDPVAQLRAEDFIRAVEGHKRHVARIVTTGPVVSITRIAAPADDELDAPAELVADIHHELIRLANRPQVSWMRESLPEEAITRKANPSRSIR